ncbi:MAG: hypothetical protein WCD89_25390 [Anaerocolumna sp.]
MKSVRLNTEGLQEHEKQSLIKSQLDSMDAHAVFLSEGQSYVDINYIDHPSVTEINTH